MAENSAAQNSWGATWRLTLYALATMLASCVMLLVNLAMIFVLFNSLVGYIPEAAVVYIGQLMLYVGPYLLLFLEWRLWDSLTDPFQRGG